MTHDEPGEEVYEEVYREGGFLGDSRPSRPLVRRDKPTSHRPPTRPKYEDVYHQEGFASQQSARDFFRTRE